jgi:hypothetical protein
MGVGGLYVAWLNFFSTPSKAESKKSDVSASLPSKVQGAGQAPPPSLEDSLEDSDDGFVSSGSGGGDANEGRLKSLETPTGLDPAPLLQAGRQPLGKEPREGVPAPTLHPEQWKSLPDLSVAAPPASPAGTPALPSPPPVPEFFIETSAGKEVWFQGQGFRPGATLPGGYALKRITPSGILLAGPSGSVFSPLKTKASIPSKPSGGPVPSPAPQGEPQDRP